MSTFPIIFLNPIDSGFNDMLTMVYNFLQLSHFDLVIRHGILDLFYFVFCCVLVPTFQLFQFAQNNALFLLWKLGCKAMFYLIYGIVFVITLASVLRVSNMTLLYNLQGYPDEKTKESIERVMKSITSLKIKSGISIHHVALTEAHWAFFEFKVHPFYRH